MSGFDGPRIGPFVRGAPHEHWGGGVFVARRVSRDIAPAVASDVDGGRVILQLAFDAEAQGLHGEAAWRAVHPHPHMPSLADHGEDGGPAWIAYTLVAAVRLEYALAVHPLPLVLSWAHELVQVMAHHARHGGGADALRPSLADLLVTSDGRLLVLTAPAAARTWRTSVLRHSYHHRVLEPPAGALEAGASNTAVDVFTAGAMLRHTLREKKDEPRGDVPLRVRQLVARAMGPVAERHESLAELERELRACLDEFPHLEASERAAAVRAVAGEDLERVARSLS